MNLNKVGLVTGASSGIGKAIAQELIKRGWIVIGVARSSDKLLQIREDLSDAFIPVICDVSNKENIKQASEKILEMKLCPSLFFLNAGIAGEAVIENPNRFDLKIHENIMNVNYFGGLAWIEYFEKVCSGNGGANFIATSSVNAIFAPPTGSAYCASKAAVAKAFESLNLTYFGTGLRFSVVYPGPVDTAGLKGKVPFTWKAEKMGKYMVDFALSKKSRGEPSFFYAVLTRLLRGLPTGQVAKFFKNLG